MTQSADPNAKPGFGKGGGFDHEAVQTAQAIAVNPADEVIPSNVDVEENIAVIHHAEEQEEDTDLKTTDGYVIDESGRIDNFAVEPPMYIEDHGQRIELDQSYKS